MIDNTPLLLERMDALHRVEKQKQRPPSARPSCSAQCGLYAKRAREALQNISALRDLIIDKRREYLEFSAVDPPAFVSVSRRMRQRAAFNELDRRQFDANADIAIGQCSKLIEELEHQAKADASLRKEDERLHTQLVTQILKVYLKDVCSVLMQLKSIHRSRVKFVHRMGRLSNLVEMLEEREATQAEERRARETQKGSLQRMGENLLRQPIGWALIGYNSKKKAPPREEVPSDSLADLGIAGLDHYYSSPTANDDDEEGEGPALPEEAIGMMQDTMSGEEQALLGAENSELMEQFSQDNSELQKIEQRLDEMQRLQDLFTERVVDQERGIETIHAQTIRTIDNVDTANNFIREAMRNGASRRTIALFCLIVLTLALLFIDWYNP